MPDPTPDRAVNPDAESWAILGAIEDLRLIEREDGGSTRDRGSERARRLMESITARVRRLAAAVPPPPEDPRLRLPHTELVDALMQACADFTDRIAGDPDHDGMWPADVMALREELARRRADAGRMPVEVDTMTLLDILDGVLRPDDVEKMLLRAGRGGS